MIEDIKKNKSLRIKFGEVNSESPTKVPGNEKQKRTDKNYRRSPRDPILDSIFKKKKKIKFKDVVKKLLKKY